MRHFKLRICKHPLVEAAISVSQPHLDIYKKILRITTDRGFGNSFKGYIRTEFERGQSPFVIKAALEHMLPNVMATIASNYLEALFSDSDLDDIVEQHAENHDSSIEAKSAACNVIPFSDTEKE